MLRRIHQAAPGLHHEARQRHAGLLQRLRQRRQRFITPEMKLNMAESLRFRCPDPIAEIDTLHETAIQYMRTNTSDPLLYLPEQNKQN